MHAMIEGTVITGFLVSVINGTLGDGGFPTPFQYRVDTFKQAKKLATQLVQTFNLQGIDDVAHNWNK